MSSTPRTDAAAFMACNEFTKKKSDENYYSEVVQASESRAIETSLNAALERCRGRAKRITELETGSAELRRKLEEVSDHNVQLQKFYLEIQKTCHAKDKKLEETRAALTDWQRVAGELYKVLTDSGTRCEQLHHGKKDQHGSHIACPVEARIEAVRAAFRALSEPTQPSASPPSGS